MPPDDIKSTKYEIVFPEGLIVIDDTFDVELISTPDPIWFKDKVLLSPSPSRPPGIDRMDKLLKEHVKDWEITSTGLVKKTNKFNHTYKELHQGE